MGKALKIAIGVGLMLIPGANIVNFGLTLGLSVGTGIAIAEAAFAIGASIAISGIAGVVAGSQKSPQMEDPGLRLNLTVDQTAPREICYGKAATGGTLIFRDTVGTKNSDLWMVTALAGHEIDSVVEVTLGGVVTTFSSNNAVGAKNGKWYQYEHLGLDAQVADSPLVAASTKWTTTDRLRGVACIVNKMIYDQVVWDKGLESVIYVIKGKKVYDPRLDSTNGGSGTHRFTDKTTWEWSENPVLCAVDYLRGETQNGVGAWGMNTDTTNLDWPHIISEANICDEAVTLKAGGTEKRYTCNGFLSTADNHKTNLKKILSSCAGNLVWQSGKWRIYVGAARAAIKSRTESHIISAVKYMPKKEYLARANGIRGLFNDPNEGYKAKDYPPVLNATFLAQDGGQEIWGDLNLPMTKSAPTAQRLANIALKAARMEKTFSAVVNTIGLQDQVMDSVNLTYSRFNISAQKMVITDWALRYQTDDEGKIGIVFEETFLETDDTIYSWTAASDEATIPVVGSLLSPAPVLLDWDDITGTGKPADGATVGARQGINLFKSDGITNYATSEFENNIIENSVLSIPHPGGAKFYEAGTGNIGAIKIALPVTWNSSMVRFFIDIFNYSTGTSFTVEVGGYLYIGGTSWLNYYARIIGGINTNHSVRLGHDGTKCCVWIGELTDNWNYLQVSVRDFKASYANYTIALWEAGWAISRVASFTGVISATIANALVSASDTVNVNGVAAATVESYAGRAGLGLDSAGDLSRKLKYNALIDQGNGTGRPFLRGLEYGAVNHGDVVVFNTAYASVPSVQFLPSGKTIDSGLTGDVVTAFDASNLTTSGFTASALLKELAGTPTAHTDTGAVVGATYDYELEKVNTTPNNAWNDQYTATLDVTVLRGVDGDAYSGTCTVGFFIKLTSGGGWVMYGSKEFSSWDVTPGSTAQLNQTIIANASGLTDFAGVQFAVDIISSTPSGSVITSFDSVAYATATAPGEASATPVGSSPIPYRVFA